MKKRILYIIRSEADFERVVCLAIAGKNMYDQLFIFCGDFSPYFNDGIKNTFQKRLFRSHGFSAKDFHDYGVLGRITKWITKRSKPDNYPNSNSIPHVIGWLMAKALLRILKDQRRSYIKRVLKINTPDYLFTDQSMESSEYLPQMFREQAIELKIPVYLFTHGAAGGIHNEFSEFRSNDYEGCTVFACSKREPGADKINRIIVGDPASSYPYVNYINGIETDRIEFLITRKYKVGFIVGGTMFTSTNGWSEMQEIIIKLSENPDVAMVLKLHPREAPHIDLRMLERFNNLLIVDHFVDRSRVSKWADYVVCSDHCSTIFEPMILEKKVIAVEGVHLPKYKDVHSPLKKSSVKHISSASEFIPENIAPANPFDVVTNEVAWGGHGNRDLAALAMDII
jgi:hypothetical protein